MLRTGPAAIVKHHYTLTIFTLFSREIKWDGWLDAVYLRIKSRNSLVPFSKKLNMVKPRDLREAAGNKFLYLAKQLVFRI